MLNASSSLSSLFVKFARFSGFAVRTIISRWSLSNRPEFETINIALQTTQATGRGEGDRLLHESTTIQETYRYAANIDRVHTMDIKYRTKRHLPPAYSFYIVYYARCVDFVYRQRSSSSSYIRSKNKTITAETITVFFFFFSLSIKPRTFRIQYTGPYVYNNNYNWMRHIWQTNNRVKIIIITYNTHTHTQPNLTGSTVVCTDINNYNIVNNRLFNIVIVTDGSR